MFPCKLNTCLHKVLAIIFTPQIIRHLGMINNNLRVAKFRVGHFGNNAAIFFNKKFPFGISLVVLNVHHGLAIDKIRVCGSYLLTKQFLLENGTKKTAPDTKPNPGLLGSLDLLTLTYCLFCS